MNGLDIALVVLIVGIGVVGIVRGFGRTLLDALALYAALWLSSAAMPMVAGRISLHAGGSAVNQGWALGLLFVVFGGLLLALSWYVYGMTQFDAGMFDKLLGLVAGLAAGAIVAHGIVTPMVTADPTCVAAASLVNTGTVGSELYSFTNYHSVMDTITGDKTYMREAPSPETLAGK